MLIFWDVLCPFLLILLNVFQNNLLLEKFSWDLVEFLLTLYIGLENYFKSSLICDHGTSFHFARPFVLQISVDLLYSQVFSICIALCIGSFFSFYFHM